MEYGIKIVAFDRIGQYTRFWKVICCNADKEMQNKYLWILSSHVQVKKLRIESHIRTVIEKQPIFGQTDNQKNILFGGSVETRRTRNGRDEQIITMNLTTY